MKHTTALFPLKRPFYYGIKIHIGLTIILTILTLNCSKTASPNLMSDEKFIDILARLMIIEQLKIGQNEKLPLIKEVFKEYNTTRTAFDAYKKYYENDTKHWITIYRKTEKRIKELSSPDKVLNPALFSKRDSNAVRH